MPVVNCRGCDRKTNTAVSRVDDIRDWGKHADACAMAVLNDGTAVQGCAYGAFDIDQKRAVDQFIIEQPWKEGEPMTDAEKSPVKPTGTTHDLKCWIEFWEAIKEGRKTFDVRKGMDRTYGVGDRLRLRRYDPELKDYTSGEILARVTYIMRGTFGIPDDVWVLGLRVENVQEPAR